MYCARWFLFQEHQHKNTMWNDEMIVEKKKEWKHYTKLPQKLNFFHT